MQDGRSSLEDRLSPHCQPDDVPAESIVIGIRKQRDGLRNSAMVVNLDHMPALLMPAARDMPQRSFTMIHMTRVARLPPA